MKNMEHVHTSNYHSDIFLVIIALSIFSWGF